MSRRCARCRAGRSGSTAAGALGALERALLARAFGEYLARIEGGIPMSQGEIARLAALGVDEAAIARFGRGAVRQLIRDGTAAPSRARLAALIADGAFGDWGLADDTLEMIREQFRRFADEQVAPHAHGWHARDELIPLELVEALGELGVFGLTVPEAWGGLGLGKAAMCVVTEELSRGYIGVGSLGTRSEIAAELIRLAGTDDAEGALPAEDRLGRRSSRPRCSPSPTPAPTSRRCRPARSLEGERYRITAPRPGSRTPRAPT